MFSESMFKTLGGNFKVGPTAEDLKLEAERATKISRVIFKKYVTKAYNLSDPKDAESYSTDMMTITIGLEKRTHVLFHRDRQFDTTKGGWLAMVEWGEFELQETDVKTVPSI